MKDMPEKLTVPHVSEQEAAQMVSGARVALGGHPIDEFMAGVFDRLEKIQKRPNKPLTSPTKKRTL